MQKNWDKRYYAYEKISKAFKNGTFDALDKNTRCTKCCKTRSKKHKFL
jgi:hypothetical protein